ncbi:MAG TPA: hypothetical protein VFE11_09235, partial [Dongiaceae bacterium]|nr:hypothetical protein [Dongiaceae bacterium]
MRQTARRTLAMVGLVVTIVTSFGSLADDAVLMVTGKVPGGEVTLTRDQIAKLPQRELAEQPTSFPAAMNFKGPLLA